MPPPKDIPSSILIIGSGVFGLGAASALITRPEYANTTITLVDRTSFPAPDAGSIDTSRLVRADYADGAYAALMTEAAAEWRGEFGADGRYTEAGLCFVLDEDATTEGAADYMLRALANVRDRLGLRVGEPGDPSAQLSLLDSPAAIAGVMRNMGGALGSRGYVNWTSGWADAEAGMRYLRKKVESSGRVKFRTGKVAQLAFEDDAEGQRQVVGARLDDGETLSADLTLLAAGAWSPALVDLRGIASASGQALAYIALTPEEHAALGENPTILNESSGCFIMPSRGAELKVARHGYGYANPQTMAHPERRHGSDDDGDGIPFIASVPRTAADDAGLQIPREASEACRTFLARCVPRLAEREWARTRICWYCDTARGDWLVDYHPRYEGLFVATGGSGHGYKFLPVVGERIVDVMMGRDRDELGHELKGKWAWPERRGAEDHVWTEDWRGGRKGMVLDEELDK